jgi:serine/threonine protein kinase
VPFPANSMDELREKLKNGSYSIPKTIILSLEGASFLNQLLQYDIKDRIGFEDIYVHPYLSSDQYNAIAKD